MAAEARSRATAGDPRAHRAAATAPRESGGAWVWPVAVALSLAATFAVLVAFTVTAYRFADARVAEDVRAASTSSGEAR
jgi:hypothetical protein